MNSRKILAALISVFLLAATVAGCAAAPATVYESDSLRIITAGRNTTIKDLATGKEYHYAEKRVKKSGTGSAAQEAQTNTDTATITIQTAGRCIIVTEKQTGKTIVLP